MHPVVWYDMAIRDGERVSYKVFRKPCLVLIKGVITENYNKVGCEWGHYL